MRTPRRTFLGAAASALLGLGCQSSDDDRMYVYAASSLRDVLSDLRSALPEVFGQGCKVSFGGSQLLALQIENGAPVDLFLSASGRHAEAAHAAGYVSEPYAIANASLAVVMRQDDSTSLKDLEALARSKRIVLGTPRSPIGVYTDMLLEAGRNHFGQNWYAAVTDHVISWEVSARLLRMRVEMGAADASIIYEPDAKTGRGLRTLNIPSPCAIEATYFAAAGLGRSGRGAPQRLIEELASTRARAAFLARGFRPI